MCDTRLDHLCSQEPRNIEERSTPDASVASAQYLCYFMHRLLDFRQPEVKSLADMTGCCTDADSDSFGFEEPYGGCKLSPFWYLRLPSESVATSILQRSLLVKVQHGPMLYFGDTDVSAWIYAFYGLDRVSLKFGVRVPHGRS